jgi:hypothetical protein
MSFRGIREGGIMKRKNPDDSHDAVSTDPLAKETIQSMADLALDSLKEEYRTEWEPYELYAQKLRSHVHANPHEFSEKFKKGYETLLERIKDKG